MTMTQMVRQTVITPQLISAASMLLRLGHPGEASLHRALERAEGRLLTQPWRVDSGILQIASASRPNEVVVTDGVTCNCPTTRGTCYHVASWHIISALCAAGCYPVADLPLPAALDTDELPASFLDGDFSAFDDFELTAPIERSYFDEVDEVTAWPRRVREAA